jgi:hypothetical protein
MEEHETQQTGGKMTEADRAIFGLAIIISILYMVA